MPDCMSTTESGYEIMPGVNSYLALVDFILHSESDPHFSLGWHLQCGDLTGTQMSIVGGGRMGG